MIPYIYSHLAFYILLVSYPPSPVQYQYRISGGYDSCLVASHILKSYHTTASVKCMSGIEWDKSGRPGVTHD